MVMITMYFCSLTDTEDKAGICLPQLIYSDSCAVTSGISLCSCKYGAYANTGANWWWWCGELWEGLSVESWLMEIFAFSCLSSLKGFQQPSVHMQSKPSANASLLWLSRWQICWLLVSLTLWEDLSTGCDEYIDILMLIHSVSTMTLNKLARL